MSEKKRDLFQMAVLVASGLFLTCIFVLVFIAVKKLSGGYHALAEGDLTNGITGSLLYDDHFYGQIMFGIEIVPEDLNKVSQLTQFLQDSLISIDARIFSAGIVYDMIFTSLMSYALYRFSKGDRRNHVIMIVITVLLFFVIYWRYVSILHVIFKVPFYRPETFGMITHFVSLVSLIGGSCALGLLIRTVRHKRIVSAVAVPVVFALFLFCSAFEGQLFCPRQIESFSYVLETDSRATDPAYKDQVYYDEARNVLVVVDKEYPPGLEDNPDYLKGISRIGACLFEVIDPYSGESLFLASEAVKADLPAAVLIAYDIKGIIWIAAAKLAGK